MTHHAPARVAVYAVIGALLLVGACEKGPPAQRPPGAGEPSCPSDLLAAVGTPCAPDGATCGTSGRAGFTHLLMCSGDVWIEMEAPPPPPPPPPPPTAPLGPQAVDLRDYDKTCRRDADCELVRASRCGACGCTSDPLAVREHERFAAALSAIQCAPIDPASFGATINCGGCQGYEAWCDHGSCAARTR